MKLLGRHRVRATFYHIIAATFLFQTWAWFLGLISDQTSLIIAFTLFFVDYMAEMYDPHPDKPGPWYKRFHRAVDDKGEDNDF